jgi:tetratricopeptide (TPR) repeat protein
VLPVDVEVQALQPHAHYRARSVVATAHSPDGKPTTLIAIRAWDYRWQHLYRYVTPVSLPRGTRIDLRYEFDNSEANPRNPQLPPQPVRWGQRATDEMGDLWVQLLARTDGDREILQRSVQRKHIAEEIVGYQTMIRDQPSSVPLHNDVAVLYSESGAFSEAARHLEIVQRLQPDSPAAHYNLATTLSRLGKIDDAVAHYRMALALKGDYAAAHNNLGQSLLAQNKPDEAAHHFREAARLDPVNAEAQYNLGVIAQARGDWLETIDRFRRAVAIGPDFVAAVTGLAWTLATAPSPAMRDGAQANTLAMRAARLTNRKNARVLDVLAAAQAAAGLFEAAVLTGEEAIGLAPDASLTLALQRRVALYRQRRPYTEPNPLP